MKKVDRLVIFFENAKLENNVDEVVTIKLMMEFQPVAPDSELLCATGYGT